MRKTTHSFVTHWRANAVATRRRILECLFTFMGTPLCATALAQPAVTPVAPNTDKPASPTSVPTPAGTIDLVTGEVAIIKPGAPRRGAVLGDVVNEGDSLVTGKDSEVHLTMQDAGFIALRPNTQFKIVRYKAEGGSDDKGVFGLLVGGMRSVTGWIGKFNQSAYQVRTPSATIGIRGTDHETHHVAEGSAEGEAGTYDKVYSGGTTIRTAAGRAEVTPNQAGFVSLRGKERPRLLERVPFFFRPGPNEAVIDGKHAEVQRMVSERREERRKIVAEKRAALGTARPEQKSQADTGQAIAEERSTAAQQQRKDARERRQAAQEERKAHQQQEQKRRRVVP